MDSLRSDSSEFLKIPIIKTLVEKKHFSLVNQVPQFDLEKDHDFFSRIRLVAESLLNKRNVTTIKELLSDLDFKKSFLFYVTLFDFFSLQVYNSLHFGIDDAVPFIKNCMIGLEGCVNPDGYISICYKSNSFIIGNVLENTWYFDKIKEYHEKRYGRENLCKYCFAQRFCNLCYEKLSGKEGAFDNSFNNFCEFNRAYHRMMFEYMLQIMENNPALWDELQKLAELDKEIILKKREEKNLKQNALKTFALHETR